MAEITTISAQPRDRSGKGASRAVRRMGRVPAIIYGDNQAPIAISIEARELSRAVARAGFLATLVDVDVGGSVHRTLPREVQQHPVTDMPLHVDFMRIGSGARITVNVPVAFIDQERSPGLRRGGILNVVRHTIEMSCTVDAIPDRLIVSLAGLDIGDSLHVSAVTLPEGTRPTITDRDFTIASIATSSAVREEALAAASAAPAGEEAAG